MGLLERNDLTQSERIQIIDAVRGKLPIDYSTEMTVIPVEFEEQSSRIPVIIPEREDVPSFFEDYIAQRGSCRIIYKTTSEWDAEPTLVGYRGYLYVYLDADSYVDEHGNTVYVPAIKLGDGETPLIDLPFMTAQTSQEVIHHLEDAYAHWQEGEREALQATLEGKVDITEFSEYIEIDEAQGYFDAETIAIIQTNPIKRIKYDDRIYTMTMRRSGVYRYTTGSDDANFAKFIDVNVSDFSWHCYNNENDVLAQHINDTTVHITDAKRTFWNRKLNYDTVSEERLILNRN